MKTLALKSRSKEKLFCVALIKPVSHLASQWESLLPAYCIYEFDPAFHVDHGQIRFGDGQGQFINRHEIQDLILLPDLDKDQMDQLGLFV